MVGKFVGASDLVAHRKRIERLQDLVEDEELLVSLVAEELEYHQTLSDQVGLPSLLARIVEGSPEETLEAIAKAAEKPRHGDRN